MALCMQHLEILLQIGQHFVSVEQRDHLIPTQLILLSILLDAERKEIGAYSGGYPFSISGDIRSVSS